METVCSHCLKPLDGVVCRNCCDKPRAKWGLNLLAEIQAIRERADSAFFAEIMEPKVEVISHVLTEREFQDMKHGSIEKSGHTIGEWILIMESELAEAKVALIKGGTGRDSVRSEVLQVVSVGFACLEQHGVREIKERTV